MRTGPNIIFVDKPYFERFGLKDNSPASLWHLPPWEPTDAHLYPEGKKTLKIDAFEIEKKWIRGR